MVRGVFSYRRKFCLRRNRIFKWDAKSTITWDDIGSEWRVILDRVHMLSINVVGSLVQSKNINLFMHLFWFQISYFKGDTMKTLDGNWKFKYMVSICSQSSVGISVFGKFESCINFSRLSNVVAHEFVISLADMCPKMVKLRFFSFLVKVLSYLRIFIQCACYW